jgi:HSP20 family protein
LWYNYVVDANLWRGRMTVKRRGAWIEKTQGVNVNGAVVERLLGSRWVVCQHTCAWRPPTDVYDDDDGVVVRVEVAGMRSEEFSISLIGTGTGAGRKLVVAGTRVDSAPKQMYHQMEISFGEFRAEIDLPWSLEPEDVEAGYEEGFLIVRLPRPRPRRVPVATAEPEED